MYLSYFSNSDIYSWHFALLLHLRPGRQFLKGGLGKMIERKQEEEAGVGTRRGGGREEGGF